MANSLKGFRRTKHSPKKETTPIRPSRPHLISAEGILMLLWAVVIDVVNIVLGILDFFVIGIFLSPIWNIVALATVGVWLWITTGQSLRGSKRKRRMFFMLTKRLAVPLIGNSIPIAKFFPFWVWSVWGALEKGSTPQEEPSPQPAQRTVIQSE